VRKNGENEGKKKEKRRRLGEEIDKRGKARKKGKRGK
jgi:hypothetical protein